jgi:hypothetical protein
MFEAHRLVTGHRGVDAPVAWGREGLAIALVGGAAVITGVLIGGDAGTVDRLGGAGPGLFGPYVWQR